VIDTAPVVLLAPRVFGAMGIRVDDDWNLPGGEPSRLSP
jgi:hypothetical protein